MKLERLTELNALLNMDEKGDDVLDVDEDAPKKDENSVGDGDPDGTGERGGEVDEPGNEEGVSMEEEAEIDAESDEPEYSTSQEFKTPAPEPQSTRADESHGVKSLKERLAQKRAVVDARESFRPKPTQELPKAVNQTL